MSHPPNERFSHRISFSDTNSDVTEVAALFAYLAQWERDNPNYAVQLTTVQYDIVRYPFSGGAYAEIIWYAEAV